MLVPAHQLNARPIQPEAETSRVNENDSSYIPSTQNLMKSMSQPTLLKLQSINSPVSRFVLQQKPSESRIALQKQ